MGSESVRRNLITKRTLTDAERKDIRLQASILEKAFRMAGIALDSAFKVGIEEACILVEGTAATLAPVDTGLLRKSISHRVIDRAGYPIGQVGTAVEYAPFQEFGTSKMRPQPFLTPALEQHRRGVKILINRRLREVIE